MPRVDIEEARTTLARIEDTSRGWELAEKRRQPGPEQDYGAVARPDASPAVKAARGWPRRARFTS